MKEKIIWHGERPIEFRWMTISWERVYWLPAYTENKKVACWDIGWFISNRAWMPFAYHIRPETLWQRTGLYDKNWTKIYNGDIVEFENMWCSIKVWEVVFSNWCFEAYKKWYKKRWLNTICTVIWNKYQNADLLSE